MLLFVLMFLCLNKEAQAQKERWTSIGPYTGSITNVVIDPARPDTVYAFSSDSGIFKTTDGGKSWSEINKGLTIRLTLSINALAIDRRDTNTIFAATYEGVFKSVNGGVSWARVWQSYVFSSLAIDPSDSRILYGGRSASLNENCMFKSTDGGARWVPLKNQFGIKHIQDVEIVQSKTNIVYAGTDKGLIKSVDGGANWTISTLGMPEAWVYRVAVNSSNPSAIYATTKESIFKSVDGGANWTVISSGLPSTPYASSTISLSRADAIYVSIFRYGIYKSTDGGATWVSVYTVPNHGHIKTIMVDPSKNNTVFVGTETGMFKTTNGVAYLSRFEDLHISSLAMDPSASNVLYAATYKTVLVSSDGGENWSEAVLGLPAVWVQDVAVAHSDPKIVYAATRGGGIFILKR
jgi:photosystem II stability/assembly factor-like uncharacterized protein